MQIITLDASNNPMLQHIVKALIGEAKKQEIKDFTENYVAVCQKLRESARGNPGREAVLAILARHGLPEAFGPFFQDAVNEWPADGALPDEKLVLAQVSHMIEFNQVGAGHKYDTQKELNHFTDQIIAAFTSYCTEIYLPRLRASLYIRRNNLN